MTDALERRTIRDFGTQWQKFRTHDTCYYASLDFLRDVFGPLLAVEELGGLRVAEIGSGTGRIVHMLLAAGAARVWALEPSAAFEVLRENLGQDDRLCLLNLSGQDLPARLGLDLVVSIGVVHHVPCPRPVIDAVYAALRPGGRILIWVYGREGNALYLAFALPLRRLTRRLPHPLLSALAGSLDLALRAYVRLCRRLPLPAHRYVREVLGRLSAEQRRLVIYDQLNPAYARYYRRREVEDLLRASGFVEVALHHRHRYSWTACAYKPETGTPS